MKKMLLFLSWIGSLHAFAQPILSFQIIPEPGDSLHFIHANQTDPLEAMTGANQVWDFSGLSQHMTSPEYYYKFDVPNNTPHGDRYPTSFLAASTPDTQFVYYEFDGSVLELVGAVAEVPNFGTAFADYDDNETETVFPMELGTTWSDQFSGNNVAGGFGVPFSGTVTGEADGYGTLILPTGTFENVVRNRQERTYQIQGAPFTESSTLWIYSVPDIKLWLLSIEDIDGGEQLVYYSDSPQVISHSIEYRITDKISVYPNPAKPGQKINIILDNGLNTEVELSDFSGNQTLLYKGNDLSLLTLPEGLTPGIYLLSIKNEKGSFIEKFIVTK